MKGWIQVDVDVGWGGRDVVADVEVLRLKGSVRVVHGINPADKPGLGIEEEKHHPLRSLLPGHAECNGEPASRG